MTDITNARIERAQILIEDHGILTWMLDLNHGAFVQGVGGYSMASTISDEIEWIGHLNHRNDVFKKYAFAILSMRSILETIGVSHWDKLKGQYCRIHGVPGRQIRAIGHIVEDRWFDPDVLLDAINKAAQKI